MGYLKKNHKSAANSSAGPRPVGGPVLMPSALVVIADWLNVFSA
jgi:hypothetical protein